MVFRAKQYVDRVVVLVDGAGGSVNTLKLDNRSNWAVSLLRPAGSRPATNRGPDLRWSRRPVTLLDTAEDWVSVLPREYISAGDRQY